MKIKKIDEIGLVGWIKISSIIMGILLLGLVWSYASLNYSTQKINSRIDNIVLPAINEKSKVNMSNLNQNMANLWIAQLTTAEYNKIFSDNNVGRCWTFALEKNLDKIKLTIAKDWIDFDFPNNYRLELSKTVGIGCYIKSKNKPQVNGKKTQMWQNIDCNNSCNGLDFRGAQ